LQAMSNQRDQPQRDGNEHNQAGPVDKWIGALLESHRCGGNGDAAMQFADERRQVERQGIKTEGCRG